MSGRSLRRLPVLALAKYIGTMPMLASARRGPQVNGKVNGAHLGAGTEGGTDVDVWLGAMERVVDAQKEARERLEQ